MSDCIGSSVDDGTVPLTSRCCCRLRACRERQRQTACLLREEVGRGESDAPVRPLEELVIQLLLARKELADAVEEARDAHRTAAVGQAGEDPDEVVERLGRDAAPDARVGELGVGRGDLRAIRMSVSRRDGQGERAGGREVRTLTEAWITPRRPNVKHGTVSPSQYELLTRMTSISPMRSCAKR